MPELKFLPNEAGEGEGLSDAGIETYRADPFPAVARETSQNSRDAHDRQRHPTSPVRVEIERLEIPTTTLPGHSKYLEVVQRCLQLARDQNRKKEIAFFEHADRVLRRPTLPILRIADFNTLGLKGPCEEGSPFHSLVKSSGVSRKEDETSGGSFGIGKSAVYSASDLQTVFYSTSYLDEGGRRVFLSQGKTKFMSFTDGSGRPFRSVGYWGRADGYLPVEDPSLAPDWLRRSETGTTVCSIGVRDSENWQKATIGSLLMNFFSAVHSRDMAFTVDGTAVDVNTLRHWFDDPAVRDAVTQAKSEDFAFASHMYACLTDDHDAIQHSLEVPDAGRFRLRLQVRDGLPKRVGILRNGMYICDSLGHFGDKFARFPMYRDFVAIVEPDDDAASTWLKRMENPRHDEFSPERLLTPDERRRATSAGRKLAVLIRERIKEAAKPEAKDETDLDELSAFFATGSKGPFDPDGERDLETIVVKPNPGPHAKRQTRPPATAEGGEGGGATEEHAQGGRGRNGKGAGIGAGQGGRGPQRTRRPFPLIEPRTLIADPGNLRRRRLFFTPKVSGSVVLQLQSSGLAAPAYLSTVPAECRVECTADQRHMVDIELLDEYGGPIELVSWRAEEEPDEAQ